MQNPLANCEHGIGRQTEKEGNYCCSLCEQWWHYDNQGDELETHVGIKTLARLNMGWMFVFEHLG